MRSNDRNTFVLAVVAWIVFSALLTSAQSTSQEFPSPIVSNEISGTIKPRDIGDSRLTSYYYQFDGSQGDLFINIVTKNFSGDIDVFTYTGLRPLTKIVVYADLAENETGRVIYLRKPEKMLLRVQGRTPGDDAATFRIKFAGSFVASSLPEPASEPALPAVTTRNESGIRVNSVGTIVEVIPKATPLPPPAEKAASDSDDRPKVTAKADEVTEKVAEEKPKEDQTIDGPEKKLDVVVTDTTGAAPAKRAPGRTRRRATSSEAGAGTAKTTPDNTESAARPARSRRGRTQEPPTPKPPDPMENFSLVILFKDSTTVTRPMIEVLRFTVDKGVLTVVAKDGSIGRYSMIDVAKVTIE